MTARRARKSSSLAIKSAELAWAAPQVVAHRVARMALAGTSLSERDAKEFRLMHTEKAAAFTESWAAMAAQAARANQALATTWWSTLWSFPLKSPPSAFAAAAQMQRAALGVLGKGLTPVHRKAVANAKRLGRSKLR